MQLRAKDEAAASKTDAIGIGNREYSVVAKKIIGDSKGFANLRSDLVRDSSYAWEKADLAADAGHDSNWQYVLVFTDGQDHARLAFSPEQSRVMLLDDGPVLSIAPIGEATAAFFQEQFRK